MGIWVAFEKTGLSEALDMAQLMLLFRVGAERYALETTSVVEVIHRVELSTAHEVKGASERAAIAGRFNYHGQIVPVLDLNQLLGGGSSRPALVTLILSPDAPLG